LLNFAGARERVGKRVDKGQARTRPKRDNPPSGSR
jgi:hypothetical protein